MMHTQHSKPSFPVKFNLSTDNLSRLPQHKFILQSVPAIYRSPQTTQSTCLSTKDKKEWEHATNNPFIKSGNPSTAGCPFSYGCHATPFLLYQNFLQSGIVHYDLHCKFCISSSDNPYELDKILIIIHQAFIYCRQD